MGDLPDGIQKPQRAYEMQMSDQILYNTFVAVSCDRILAICSSWLPAASAAREGRMQKPALFRAIYVELRLTLGKGVPSSELLKLAFVILRSYSIEQDGTPEDGRIGTSRSFVSLPVDVAMRDGGWRVLDFEATQEYFREDRDAGALTALRPLIEKYLGPEWQHPTLTRPL